ETEPAAQFLIGEIRRTRSFGFSNRTKRRDRLDRYSNRAKHLSMPKQGREEGRAHFGWRPAGDPVRRRDRRGRAGGRPRRLAHRRPGSALLKTVALAVGRGETSKPGARPRIEGHANR